MGLNWPRLRSRRWRRVGPRTYAPARLADGPMLRLQAAACRLPEIAAFSGMSAAWLHGLDVEPCDPIEVIIPKGVGVSARAGMRVYRARLPSPESTVVHGLRTTTILRTLEDLARRLPLVESTVIVDMALNLGLTDLSTFTTHIRNRRGGRGVVNLRRVVAAAEPKSESPMETRLRMLLVLAGLPAPEAQTPVFDSGGTFVGRPDLYYPQHRLGLEYDGAGHRDRLAEDNFRQNRLLEAGVRLLRFTAVDVMARPSIVVAQVRAMLAA